MKNERLELLLELKSWDAATSEQRLAVAMDVAETLPETFVFDRLTAHTLGKLTHEIAFYKFGGSSFALVPGQSDAILGYDQSSPYRPNDSQMDDWREVEEEYGYTIEAFLDLCLTPLRRVTISPLLIETVALRFDYGRSGDQQEDGYDRVREYCGAEFRLPTPDEWEYVCAAGTRTLFRWGDDCPTSNSYRDNRFDLHRRPNAFGIVMNSSTYDSEICEGPTLRGGDGGASVCGGMGNVLTWLPFASSFRMTDEEIRDWWIDDVFVRRVRPVLA